jgi:hypothetical protein
MTARQQDFIETPSEEQQQIAAIDPANLSDLKVRFLNAHILGMFEKLSVRSQNALRNFLNERVNYTTLHRFFFREQVAVHKLSNVGEKSVVEIACLLAELKALAVRILDGSDDDLKEDLLIQELYLALSPPSDFFDEFLPQIKDGHFPLFAFLQKLILNGHFFNETRTTVFRHRMGWFEGEEELGLEEIGEQLDLTRERVRQIAHTLRQDFPRKFAFLHTLKSQLLELTGNYGIDFSKDLVFVRQSTADDINHREGTRFTRKFFAQIFSLLHADTHLLFGEQFDSFQNHYLIGRGLVRAFDFEAFVKDLRAQTQQRIKDDLEIDLDGYLYPFLKSGDVAALAQVRRVCEDLVLLEFDEAVRLDFDNLVLCRNTKIQVWEYAYEALEKIGGPAKLDVIHQSILEKYPDFDSTSEALRGTLTKEKSQFISFSRTSTYGLAKWESEREDIRGGTIRDIAEEYLQQFSEPKHYYDITDFVLQYRPATSPKSVHGNLQADESGRFREFLGGFWGLAEKNYGHFQARQLPKFTRSLATSFIIKSADPSLPNLIAYLSQACGVQPAQIRAWVDEKVRIGILRLENDKLVVLK